MVSRRDTWHEPVGGPQIPRVIEYGRLASKQASKQGWAGLGRFAGEMVSMREENGVGLGWVGLGCGPLINVRTRWSMLRMCCTSMEGCIDAQSHANLLSCVYRYRHTSLSLRTMSE